MKGMNVVNILSCNSGTSTGGILAAAVGIKEMSGEQCRELYEKLIPKIFQKKILGSSWKKYQYDKSILEEELKEYFPEGVRLTKQS